MKNKTQIKTTVENIKYFLDKVPNCQEKSKIIFLVKKYASENSSVEKINQLYDITVKLYISIKEENDYQNSIDYISRSSVEAAAIHMDLHQMSKMNIDELNSYLGI